MNLNQDIRFADIVDIKEVQLMMTDFNELTQIPIGIIDVNHEILVAAGWQKICTHFHRKHPETLKNCQESDKYIFAHLHDKEHKAYRCKNGMWDIAEPIIIDNVHYATIFLGQFQFSDKPENDSFFINQAKKFDFDQTEYIEALHSIPTYTKEKVNQIMRFYSKLGTILAQQGLNNLKLRRAYEEIEQKEKVLLQKNKEIENLNEEYKEQNKLLFEAKNKAEQSDRLKTDFINNMSHEIRTPMNGIMGFSSLLCEEELSNEKIKSYTKIINNSGKQLMRVIDDILEISRLGTNQISATEEEFCLNELLLEIFALFNIKAKEKKLAFYLERPLSDLESTIKTDKLKLNKILNNLLENALKYTYEGKIDLGYHMKDDKLIIHVKDTGIGIANEDQEVIFERFSRAPVDSHKDVVGLGLGLSIAKENAELIGGQIHLESEKNKGANFYITIPYQPTLMKIESDTVEYTILVAEDEEVNFLYLEILLENNITQKCRVIHAKNGEEAVEICRLREDVNLVLMDLKMPIMNGYKATRLIKEIRPDLPIIAQTAYSTDDDKNKAFSVGCDDFISKPISKNELVLKLDKVFSQS
ncbi:PocR ligand-binding domain-containing protein [Ancylomarina sp. YFZ004]